jgi:hypothetical protein
MFSGSQMGFAAIRVTVIVSIWADGRKDPPMVIHKATASSALTQSNRHIFAAFQKKVWVESELWV